MSKAYVVWVKQDHSVSTIVFADTAGQAKSKALDEIRDLCFHYIDFVDVYAHRIPMLDKFGVDKDSLDWENQDDRLILVKEADFSCGLYYIDDYGIEDCLGCKAREYCQEYARYAESERETE